jgi:hypothetical protein
MEMRGHRLCRAEGRGRITRGYVNHEAVHPSLSSSSVLSSRVTFMTGAFDGQVDCKLTPRRNVMDMSNEGKKSVGSMMIARVHEPGKPATSRRWRRRQLQLSWATSTPQVAGRGSTGNRDARIRFP